MAGDWIKMRMDLADDPAVIYISTKLGIGEDDAVGKLHKLWCWADRHTTDGKAPGITSRWVDKYVGAQGFADAMCAAGWISFNESGVDFPNFDRHNGRSAKARCEATIRQRLSRKNRDDGDAGVTRTNIPRPFVRAVFHRDQFTCAYCGEQSDEKREGWKKAILSVDHIVPASRGGRSSMDNLLTCCKKCNIEKNDRTPEEWGVLPQFLADGVTYVSQKICDAGVTKALPEKRREEKKETPLASRDSRASQKVDWTEAGFQIPDSVMAGFKTAYPAASVESEIAKAHAWALANPKNRKSQWGRFLNGWLQRAQDRARPAGNDEKRFVI